MAKIYSTNDELIAETRRRAHSVTVLGNTVDGSPLVAARGGGAKAPAIFITAGSHSTEHAGVAAAVQLIDELDTEHQVYVIPTRDPVGLNGGLQAVAECQNHFPELLITDRPWRTTLDQAPFM